MKQLKLTAYNDPGHGWVRVAHALIVELGVETKISLCSYMNDKYVYLEEDCDASLVLNAAKEAGYDVQITDKYSNGSSSIREYGSYDAAWLGGAKIGDVLATSTGTRYTITGETKTHYNLNDNMCHVSKNKYTSFYKG